MRYLAQPGPTLPDRFAWLIGGLCHSLVAVFMRDRSTGPLTVLVRDRLRRLATRFAALAARVEAGTLRPSRVRVTPRKARVASPRAMPGGYGWLLRLMPEGNGYAEYLEQQVLADPGFASLLAAAPQAGRTARQVALPALGVAVGGGPEAGGAADRAGGLAQKPGQVKVAGLACLNRSNTVT